MDYFYSSTSVLWTRTATQCQVTGYMHLHRATLLHHLPPVANINQQPVRPLFPVRVLVQRVLDDCKLFGEREWRGHDCVLLSRAHICSIRYTIRIYFNQFENVKYIIICQIFKFDIQKVTETSLTMMHEMRNLIIMQIPWINTSVLRGQIYCYSTN